MPMSVRSLLAVVVLVGGAGLQTAQAATWTEQNLHDFSSDDNGGYSPNLGVMIGDDGALYGSTYYSKARDDGSVGDGVIFRYDSGSKKYSVLYAFDSQDDSKKKCGRNPSAILISDSKGGFYGTTYAGGVDANGKNGGGVLFRLTPPSSGNGKWVCRVQYTFSKAGPANANTGYNPFGGLLRGPDGTLYGTAQAGGHFGGGVVFSFVPSSKTYKVLYYFSNKKPADNPNHNWKTGYGPTGRLVRDSSSGVLYGSTYFGGNNQGGVIYKLTPSGSKFTFAVVYRFPYNADDAIPAPKGYQPSQNGLLIDSNGVLYGETLLGGEINGEATNGGVIFKIKPNGAYSIVHVFDSNDATLGFSPLGGLTMGPNGEFYGVVRSGGGSNAGAVFKLNNTNYGLLYSFTASDDGGFPNGPVSIDANKVLYGTTYQGGDANQGVLFQLKK
jgi:uncharacterized repeat protein (TIGR03803 family)